MQGFGQQISMTSLYALPIADLADSRLMVAISDVSDIPGALLLLRLTRHEPASAKEAPYIVQIFTPILLMQAADASGFQSIANHLKPIETRHPSSPKAS